MTDLSSKLRVIVGEMRDGALMPCGAVFYEILNAADENDRLQAIVDGFEAVSRGDYVIEYGWNSDENKMGYWWGPRGSFVSDSLTWAGTSRQDAWLAVGLAAAEKARGR